MLKDKANAGIPIIFFGPLGEPTEVFSHEKNAAFIGRFEARKAIEQSAFPTSGGPRDRNQPRRRQNKVHIAESFFPRFRATIAFTQMFNGVDKKNPPRLYIEGEGLFFP